MEPRQRYVVIGAHLQPQASPRSIHETEDILNGYAAKGYRVAHVFSGSFLLLEWVEDLDLEQEEARRHDAAKHILLGGPEVLSRGSDPS